jgi:hypothetical protein
VGGPAFARGMTSAVREAVHTWIRRKQPISRSSTGCRGWHVHIVRHVDITILISEFRTIRQVCPKCGRLPDPRGRAVHELYCAFRHRPRCTSGADCEGPSCLSPCRAPAAKMAGAATVSCGASRVTGRLVVARGSHVARRSTSCALGIGPPGVAVLGVLSAPARRTHGRAATVRMVARRRDHQEGRRCGRGACERRASR